MANPIAAYFQNALCSMAAYANFTAGMSGQRYKEGLTANGFTDSLADTFISTYRVVGNSFTDPVTGLSVTLFESVATGEKILAIRGTNPNEINDHHHRWATGSWRVGHAKSAACSTPVILRAVS